MKYENLEKPNEAVKESASVNVMDNSDLLRELKISPRTAQTWRDTGIIPFSMVGRKIYYKTKDVEELLNRTRIDNKV